MKTTQQWWDEVSSDEAKFIDWMKDQYHGERTAAERIRKIRDDNGSSIFGWPYNLLSNIIKDEIKHTFWVENLLLARGVTPEILQKEERYWNQCLPPAEGKSFEYWCAVGHLAETMRLDRIKLLASDSRFTDVKEVFERILPEEEFHAKIFGMLSTPEDIAEARVHHNDGMNAIGLLP